MKRMILEISVTVDGIFAPESTAPSSSLRLTFSLSVKSLLDSV